MVTFLSRGSDFRRSQEGRTHEDVARKLADIQGYDFIGTYDPARAYGRRLFFVPDDTLLLAHARRLGIVSADDLFGGVVPSGFVKTKAITHELVGRDAERPDGWSHAFSERVRQVVLPGYTAFSRADVRTAGARLLRLGPVRVKQPLAAGGRGQCVVTTLPEIDCATADIPEDQLTECGCVLESQLDKADTLSIGHVALRDVTITYYGRQQFTNDATGRCAYGGSTLVCVRGGWDALNRLDVTPAIRTAMEQAQTYDAASVEYDLIASRRNYDVGQGFDADGRWRSGVFEQGWRVGGASGAEALALEALRRDPQLDVVHAATVQAYGNDLEAPPAALIHFRGEDGDSGPMLRYSVVQRCARLAA